MNDATYAKLNDGNWGLRIASDTVTQGDRVRAVRKDGTATTKIVGTIVFQKNGVTLAQIGGEESQPRPSYRRRRPCGYPGCTGYGHCDECS
jgi:hypothetical protein